MTSFAWAHSATGCDQPAAPASPTSASARSPLSRAPVTHVGEHAVTLGVGSLHGLPSTLARRADLATGRGRMSVQHVDFGHTEVAAWPHAAIGDEVTVFGAGAASATDLAETIGTVGEEILVRVSPLVPRIYRGE